MKKGTTKLTDFKLLIFPIERALFEYVDKPAQEERYK